MQQDPQVKAQEAPAGLSISAGNSYAGKAAANGVQGNKAALAAGSLAASGEPVH